MRLFYLTFLLLLLTVVAQAGELRCLRPGAPVLSLYKDSRYFPGRVEALGESIDVTFENGKQQSYSSYSNEVIVDDVPDVNEMIGGSRVLARRPKSTSFEPGFVNGTIEGLPLNDTFLVNYDSGDSIARNIMEIRLATKPSTCMNEKGIYIGCFENILNDYLTNYYPVNPTDVATCNWACFSRGFNFAGLQNGTWCFCGNHINDSLKVDDNDCNIACRDSREDVCGGYERMTVYWTGAESSINITNEQTEFTDTNANSPTTEQAVSTTETPPNNNDCFDVYDTDQCNSWAENSRCIKEPEWMIANCKKSCYACGANDPVSESVKPYSSSQPAYETNVVDQSQFSVPSQYPSSTQPQSLTDYGYSAQPADTSNYYPSSQDPIQSSVKKSSHPASNNPKSAGYLGCFKDSPSSHDLEFLADIKPVSIRACITKCKSMRFPYAGVQSSTSCYCGLHYGKYGQTAHEDCNTPCEGDSSEMCGGIVKSSIYNTGFALNVKVTENALVGKTLPSYPQYLTPSSVSRQVNSPPTVRSIYRSPSEVVYQSPQSPYSQPSRAGDNPTAYAHGKSVYAQPASSTQTTYNQVRHDQTNGYPPAPSFNHQGGNVQQSSPAISSANRQPPDFSPSDSSSYRWRETYVKLRAQEQEQSSRISSGNKWHAKKHAKKSRKLNDVSWRKISGNTLKHNSRKTLARRKHSKKPANSLPWNARKQTRFQKTHSRHVSKVHHGRVSHSLSKKGTKIHKSFAKPGIFLRKKAWKNNSFLAFLPHEVAKDEFLLENVYNMLSQMLKNLRKHRKNTKSSHSMKTLKQYLKLPVNRHQEKMIEKVSPKELHNNPESLSQSETHPKVTSKRQKDEKKLKIQELSSRLDGQKQLDKDVQHPKTWHGKAVTYLSRDNSSKMFNNESFSDGRLTGKPSYIYKVIVRPESVSSDETVTSFLRNLDSGLRNNNTSNKHKSDLGTPNSPGMTNMPSLSSKNARSKSDSRRNSSTSFKEDDNRNESKDHRNGSDDIRNESKKNQSHGRSPENDNEEYASVRQSHGGKKKLVKILKIDAPLVKEMKRNSTNDVLVDKSDEDIISTIVEVLEKERRAERKRRRQRKKYTRRNNNKHRKRRGENSTKKPRHIISKKDHVQKRSGRYSDNLMEEEENYDEVEGGGASSDEMSKK